jgi:hypothetical protein
VFTALVCASWANAAADTAAAPNCPPPPRAPHGHKTVIIHVDVAVVLVEQDRLLTMAARSNRGINSPVQTPIAAHYTAY